MYIFGRNEGYIFKFESDLTDNSHQKNLKSSESIKINNQNIKNFKKNINSTIINNTPEIDLKVNIDKTFVPSANTVFMLDTRKMSFVMNPKNPNEIKENIKIDAIKKITREKTVIESEFDSSDNYSNSYSDNMENSQSNDHSMSQKSMTLKKKSSDEYYHVNMSAIKLLIYDTSKEALVEIDDGNKISQMEMKKNHDHKKKDEEFLTNKPKKSSTSEKVDDSEEELEDLNMKEGILIKQIEYALSKEENQPTITFMKYISFFIFLLIITSTGVFLAFFLISNDILTENKNLIYNSFTLIYNTIFGIYHSRELILLNNPKYTNLYQIRTEYIKNNTDILLDLFSKSHDLLTSVITTNLPISTDNYNSLYNTNISTYILEDDLQIKPIKLKLSSSIIETNTALYHIAHQDVSEIIPTSKDVFFFMYNSINNIYNMLFKQTEIFIQEINLNLENYKLVFLYIFLVIVGICIISYFLISYAYMAVGKRKESYLEVFFEIGEGVIRNSIEKCEKFTKKFQSDNIAEDVSNLDEAEIIHDQNTSLLMNVKASRSPAKKRKNNNSKDDKIVKLKILIGLFVICVFFFVIYFIYQDYMKYLMIYVDIYNNNCVEQAYFLMIFNILREYFFDKNTDVFGVKINDYMLKSVDDIYKFKLERENVIIYLKYSF